MNGSTNLPTGTVTFLFTDIEGSTRLLHQLGEGFPEVNDRHLAILREAISTAGGTTVRTEGDAFFAAFPTASSAVKAAVAGQRALADQPWPEGVRVSVRMGLHTGEGKLGGDDYVGIDVVRAARIADVGNGGQILMSESTSALATEDLPETTRLRDLGSHELKDLEAPELIRELLIDGLQQDFPPLRTRIVRGNLPDILSSFIGREALVARALGFLDHTRLLTMVGPGGTGKTRLSIRVAEQAGSSFSDGSFFVALSAVSDPRLAPSTILNALGVRAPDEGSPGDHLLDHVRDKSLLFVLDNLEQILGVGVYLTEVLGAAPSVKIVTTSRAPLGVSGEQVLPVPPLEVPDFEGEIVDLMSVESIRLFTERAAAMVPGFELTEANAPAVVELARKLDGLPLALELAANRVKVMSPVEILERLGPRVLSGGARDLEPRQQTMWNAIAWSYDLLTPEHAGLFRRLGLFTGGARLAEIEAVCRPESELGLDTLDGLTALVDQSLVQVRRLEETRYTMLHVLREFAVEKLSDEERSELEERHASTYLALAEEARAELLARDRGEWLDRLERDIDNLRSALAYFIDNDRADEAMRFAFALWRLWQARGLLHEGRTLVTEVLALEGGAGLSRLRANEASGGLAYWQSDFEAMTHSYQNALDLARQLEDPLEEANALYNASFGPIQLGNNDEAIALLEEAREIYDAHPHDVGLGEVLLSLALIRAEDGEYQDALDASEQAVDIARRIGDDFRLSWALASTSYMAFEANNPVAREYLDQSLDMFERAGDLSGIVFALGATSFFALEEKDGPRAALLYGATVGHIETSATNLFMSNSSTQWPLEELAALAEEHPADFALGLGLSTEEAIAAARKRT